MRRHLYLLFVLVFLSFNLFSQSQFKNWSKWIPIIDRNENKVHVSISFEPDPAGLEFGIKTVYFNFKLLNRYDEPITGRLQFSYVTADGIETQMNCPVYCLQPDEVYFNIKYSLVGVSKVIDFKFAAFSPCSDRSKLLAYTAKDSIIFSLYNEIKKKEEQKRNLLASLNENDKKNILIDNSDKAIFYKGPHEPDIKAFLSKVKGWRTNSGLQIQDGIPPRVAYNGQCQRDAYVNSAVLYAWAAESYYRIKETEKAIAAANRVGEMLQAAKKLCSSGGLSFRNGQCKTEEIFPCSGANSQQLSTTSSNNDLISSSQPDEPANFDKEKELFAGLLPVISAYGTDSYEAQATAISGFADRLAAYSEGDSMSGGFMKVMMKLAALNVKMQAKEITNNIGPALTTNSMNSVPGTNAADISTLSNTDFSQMNSFQQKAYVESIVTPLFQLFESKTNEKGLTEKEQKRRNVLEATIKLRNREYREKYGFSVKQFTEAIRNFDDNLLDKILASGFPPDTKVIHDIDITGSTTLYTEEDYFFTGLHYAAQVGNEYAINKFISLGLDVNLKASNGYGSLSTRAIFCRPIDLAIWQERYLAVKLLLEKGASLKEKSFYSYSFSAKNPVDLAKQFKYIDIIKLLEQYSNKK